MIKLRRLEAMAKEQIPPEPHNSKSSMDTLVDQRIRFHRTGCAAPRRGLGAQAALLGA
ncbi:hypothetical protein U1Q18_035404, partial [Sarracenia purpurea var. burkii]